MVVGLGGSAAPYLGLCSSVLMRWIAKDFGGFWDGGRRLGIIENSIDIHEVLVPLIFMRCWPIVWRTVQYQWSGSSAYCTSEVDVGDAIACQCSRLISSQRPHLAETVGFTSEDLEATIVSWLCYLGIAANEPDQKSAAR